MIGHTNEDKHTGSAIGIENLTREFRSGGGVASINLSIDSAELIAVIGSSGSGKSTLLRLISGLDGADGGSVCIDGAVATQSAKVMIAPDQRQIGMVFQDYALFPHLSARKNIEFAGHRLPASQRRMRAQELLDQVGLADRANHYPDALSGGEQQRVALARALIGNPKILLLDEPYSSLDSRLRLSLASLTRNIAKDLGITTILVSHDGDEALRFADRIAYMERGRLLQCASFHDIMKNPACAGVLELLLPVFACDLKFQGGLHANTFWGQNISVKSDLEKKSNLRFVALPNSASLEADDDGLGIVKSIHSLGVGIEVILSFPQFASMRLFVDTCKVIQGQRVSVQFDQSKVFLFGSG